MYFKRILQKTTKESILCTSYYTSVYYLFVHTDVHMYYASDYIQCSNLYWILKNNAEKVDKTFLF